MVLPSTDPVRICFNQFQQILKDPLDKEKLTIWATQVEASPRLTRKICKYLSANPDILQSDVACKQIAGALNIAGLRDLVSDATPKKPRTLEKIDRGCLEKLAQEGEVGQTLLLQLDAVHVAFEGSLAQIKALSPQPKEPTCFVCFALEPDVNRWLEHTFVPDLDCVGIKPLFCFRDLVVGKDLISFEELIRTADQAAIICTPLLKQKCEERELAPIGVAQEIRIAKERYGDSSKAGTNYLIYFNSEPDSACPSPVFSPSFYAKCTASNYYLNLFEAFATMKGVYRESARKLKAEFIQNMHNIGKPQILQWRKTRLAKKSLLVKAIREETLSKVKFFFCPPPPQDFTGRKQELEELSLACKTSNRVAIAGLGGMGKTTLAKKYAKEARKEYDFVYFVPASSKNELTRGLVDLADTLQIDKAKKQEERLFLLQKRLNQRGYLLIFDNVDDPETFEELQKYLPERGKSLVVTTRSHEIFIRHNFTLLSLPQFSPEEGADYLQKATGRQERANSELLTKKLGGLPLALTHAASYIRAKNITIQTYLELFDEKFTALFTKDSLTLKKDEKTILTTWNISLETIEKKDPFARKLLFFISLLSKEPIALSTLTKWLAQRESLDKCHCPKHH